MHYILARKVCLDTNKTGKYARNESKHVRQDSGQCRRKKGGI